MSKEIKESAFLKIASANSIHKTEQEIPLYDRIIAHTQSWKCCKCKSENYNDKWTCSWCRHSRCSSCKDLLG